jgi:Tol biopolymer transport system component
MKLSPDGKRAALVTVDDVSGNRDISLMDLPGGQLIRWSSHPANDWRPVWSPDSQSLAFASDRNGASAIFRRRVDGSHDDELVAAAAGPLAGRFPDDWSHDGRLVFTQDSPGGHSEMWIGTASPGGAASVLKVVGSYVYGSARVSPDGRFVAYASLESGATEVYVTSMDGSLKLRISKAGGIHPRWSRTEPKLFYYAPADNHLMSVPLMRNAGMSLEVGPPVEVFPTCLEAPPLVNAGGYELAADGSTLWLCPGSQPVPGIVTVSIGWSQALKARVP